MILKSDLKVVNKGKLYHIYMRKPFLLFFDKWIELTWSDNNKEVPMQFKSFKEACMFIDSFAE
jgi:hypothetical protein